MHRSKVSITSCFCHLVFFFWRQGSLQTFDPCGIFIFIYFFKKILFTHKRHRKRGRDIGRGRSRLPVGSLMQDSIPGPQDHDLSQKQTLNHWATQESLCPFFLSTPLRTAVALVNCPRPCSMQRTSTYPSRLTLTSLPLGSLPGLFQMELVTALSWASVILCLSDTEVNPLTEMISALLHHALRVASWCCRINKWLYKELRARKDLFSQLSKGWGPQPW